jgi:hypothetical protein
LKTVLSCAIISTKNASAKEMKNKKKMKPKIISKNINVSPQNQTLQHPPEAGAQTDDHHPKHRL